MKADSKSKEVLTDKVQYAHSSEMTDQQIKLVNMLTDIEPSCYLDIADIIIEQSAADKERIKELESILSEINDLLSWPNPDNLNKATRLAALTK